MTDVDLPGGGTVFARGLRTPPPEAIDYGLYLLGHPLDAPGPYGRLLVGLRPWTPPWPYERVDWPDFRAPRSPAAAVRALSAASARVAAGERVEVACGGGRGRTGTALAAFAVLRGLSAPDAVEWVRKAYTPKAVETAGQRRFLAALASSQISFRGE